MLSLRPSLSPIQLQAYLCLPLHSHFINGNHGWTLNETDAGGDLKRNRRDKIINKHCLLFICIKRERFSCNRIASKYHNHASAYSLQTVCCRFIYLHE